MNLEYWKKENDKLFAKAINIMADRTIEEFVYYPDFDNVTDLQECDGDDIQMFYDCISRGWPSCEPEEGEKFSVKEFVKSHIGHTFFPLFEKYVEENWEDFLDDDLIEAINDRIKVGMIVDKYCLGGGGFEVERDFQLGVVNKVAEKIKEKFKKQHTECVV